MEKTLRQRVKFLLMDADPKEVRLLRKIFSAQKEYTIVLKCVGTLTDGLDFLRRGNVDMIFSRLDLPDSQGLDTAVRIHIQAADIPLVAIVSTPFKNWSQVLKRGAQDYFFKEEIDARLLARILRTNFEYKKVREELARAGLELQAIFKAFPDLFFRLSKDGTILAYGAGRESDLYVSPEKFLKRKMQDVLPHNVGRAFSQAVHRVLKTKAPFGFEYFLTVAGEKKKFEARLLPLPREEIIAVVRDISSSENLEQRLEKINECFLSFGPDPVENINRLVASCGRMLGAACALYNRLEKNILCSIGQWNAPEGYVPEDRPQGHICYDVIKSNKEDLFVIHDLMHTAYAKTDPNICRYRLKTYVGKAVKFAGKNVGSLCVLYQKDFIPQEIDERIMGIIASAIGVEEERHRQGEAVKISEKRLRRITDNTLELITEVNLEGKVVYHSPSLKSVLGYDAEAMVGTDLFPFIHPEDLEKFKNDFYKVIKEGKASSLFRARHADGRYLWIEATGNLVTEENGQPTGIVAGWRDVTERKNTQEALIQNEEKFRLVFENAQDALLWAEADTGILVNCNKAAERLFEKSKKEIVGQHLETLHPIPERDRCREAFKQQVSGGYPSVEVPIITKSGKIRTVSVGSAVVEIGGKKIVQGIFRDVTERKKIEEALKQSEDRYHKMVDAVTLYTYSVDVVNGRAVSTRHREECLAVTGYSPEDYARRVNLWHEMIYPDDRRIVEKMIERLLAGEEIAPVEHRITRRDGETIWIRSTYVPFLDGQGKLVRYDGLVENISERKRAEEALRESEARLRTAMESLPFDFFIIDEDGCYMMQNTACREHWGDLIGKRPEDLSVDKNISAQWKENNRRAFAGEVVTGEIKFKTGDWEGYFYNIIAPIIDRGKVRGVLGVNIDITQRKEAEEALRQSETRLLGAQKSAHVGNWEWNLVTNELYWSEENYRIFGLDPQKVSPSYETFIDTIDPNDRKSVQEAIEDALNGKRPYDIDFAVIRPDNTARVINAKGQVVFDATGRAVRMVGTIQDITERKRAEEALRARMEFEKLITHISTSFINMSPEEIDKGLNSALKIVGEFSEVDRSYIFLFSNNLRTMSNTYEWCAPGVQSHIDQLQGMEVDRFPLFTKQMKRLETFHVPRIADLPFEYQAEKQFLQNQGIRSIIIVPMVYGGALFGFLGFDSVSSEKTWTQATIALLKIVGEIFANALERRRTDALLRASEAKLRQVIDLTPNFVFAKDVEGHFIIVNKAVADTYGTTVEDLLGKKDSDFAKNEEEVRNFRRDDMAVINSGKNKFIPEELITDAAGRVHVLQTTKIPFKVSGTEAPAVLGVSSDITELKEKEQRLRTLSHAIEQSPSVVIITDTKGNIEYVNPRFTEVTGYSLDEVFGKNPRLLKSSETLKAASKQMWETIISGDIWRGELPDRKKNGEIFWAQAAISSIKDEKGDIVHFLAVEQDVTERKKAEEELDDYRMHLEELVEERTRELRHSERLAATGRLAASIAHEINNPLQGIMTHLEIMHDNLPEHFEKMKNYEFVKSNIEKIKSIVMKLLDVYRGADEGKTRVAINEVIKGVESLVEHQLGLRNIRLQLSLDQNIPPIEGWRQQLHQVFLNLVLNSQDSIKKDGQIVITTSCDEKCILVQISDTGEGIRQEDMDHLFEPFFTTKTDSGTGLGLFVSHGIIKEHHGSIRVKSQVGKGSIFTVALPICNGHETKGGG